MLETYIRILKFGQRWLVMAIVLRASRGSESAKPFKRLPIEPCPHHEFVQGCQINTEATGLLSARN